MGFPVRMGYSGWMRYQNIYSRNQRYAEVGGTKHERHAEAFHLKLPELIPNVKVGTD